MRMSLPIGTSMHDPYAARDDGARARARGAPADGGARDPDAGCAQECTCTHKHAASRVTLSRPPALSSVAVFSAGG